MDEEKLKNEGIDAWSVCLAGKAPDNRFEAFVLGYLAAAHRYGLPSEKLLYAVKCAYRKHHLNDDSIGWNELSDILLIALTETMRDEAFNKWLKGKQ